MSSFQYSTRDPIQTAAAPQNLSEYCDFIIFLGIAQNLSIDFLPITWQQALQNIGEGATAEIREALLDSNTSFAFKRRLFKESFNSEELTGQILPSVIAEISILLTPSMRHCPHIMNVVGICWEIYSADEYTFSRHEPVDFSGAAVVPVLVFEKSKYGDLHSFMTNGAGKTLSFDERLQLCLEIAEAVSLMHSENVIHGDIKPQNVLVFQTSSEIYTVKVADFGYSTIHATESDLIQMPNSLHWTAPEWHHRGFLFAQAKKMDVYSLGLLVFWLLCYNNPKSAVPQSHVMMPASMESAFNFVAASLGAVQLQDAAALMEFFRISLNQNAAERSSSVEYLQGILSGEKVSSPIGNPISLNGDYPEGISKEWLMQQDTVACTKGEVRDHFTPRRGTRYRMDPQHSVDDSFQLIHSMHQFYLADYRVRIYIANCLIEATSSGQKGRSSSLPSSDMYIQSALCYEIGFGVARNQRKSYDVVDGRIAYELQLARQLRYIREEGVKHHFSSGIFNWGEREGSVQFIDRIESCGGKVGWERLQREYKSEIVDARERTLGAEHMQTLASKATLADVHRRQIRLQEAQTLQTWIEKYFSERGLGPPCRYMNAESLALTYAKQGQWEKSDELLEGVIRYYSASYGQEHPKTLRSRMSLAQSYIDRGQSKRAQELGTQVLETLERTQGLQHPDTLRCVVAVAKAYQA